jgi:hypothetical protein
MLWVMLMPPDLKMPVWLRPAPSLSNRNLQVVNPMPRSHLTRTQKVARPRAIKLKDLQSQYRHRRAWLRPMLLGQGKSRPRHKPQSKLMAQIRP